MQLTENNFLERYFKKQIQTDFFDRKPMPGESFFSFIPLELCISEDETMQSILSDRDVIDLPSNNPHDFIFRNILIEKERQNYLSSSNENRFPSEYCGHLNQMIPFLNKKLNSFKKLSPTSLEELIRCRYLFLIKKVLDIRPIQLNDDFPNPLDRGSLIHNILHDIYESLQNGKSKIILSKAWLINTNGKWKYSKTRNSKKSFPLLVLSKDKEKEILLYAETVTSYHIEMVNKQNQRFGYGNKTIWSIECEKILQSVRTILTQDINSADSTDPSYPVLFEYNFGKNNTESISLGGINLIGKIDRVDVSFNSENNHLQYIFILDYKGSNPHSKKLMIERIRNALDCQLLIYAFVIQKYLFNNFNKENLNNIMKIGYIPYNQNNSHKNKDFRKSVIALEEFPKLADEFIKTVEIYIECMKNGNFSTDPYHEMYDNYTSVVRNEMLKH